jgi:hypothetical protein
MDTRYLPCSITHLAYQCKNAFTPKVSGYKQKSISCSCISCETNPEWISSAQSTVGASCISCRKKCNIETGKFLEGVSSVRPHSSVQRTLITGTRRSSRGATVVPAPREEPVETVGPIEPTLPEGSPLEDIYNMFFLIQTSAIGKEAEAMKESFRQNKKIKRTLDDNLKNIETDKFNLLKRNGNPDYCWLCGFFIDERINYLKMQIEHPFAIKLLGSMFGTPILETSENCIKRLFSLNFLPSHEHCNQIKSQMFFVKWNQRILEPDLDVISFFLQKLINGEKQSDNTNLFKRGNGTPLLRELIASQKFHMDTTKNLAKWAIQRYSFIIHKIQDLCDIVNINNSFYTKWKSNIVERNYPSPEFNDTQNREIICKYNRDFIENYIKKDEHSTIINKYRSASQKAASDAANVADRIRQERRGSLRPGALRKKQYGGAISNNVTAIEETYTNSKTKREDIWIMTQKIYELIGANVENIFFAKGTSNENLLERLKDELKSKHTEVVQEMDDTIDKCLEIFTENLKRNEPMEPKAYDIYNDEKLNKEIFTNDWDTFLSEMELINRNIYDFLITVTPINGLANTPISRSFSQSFLPTGARQRIRTPDSPNTVFRPLSFQPRTASVSPALPRPASVSPALPRTASVSPVLPRQAFTPIARRTSFDEAEEEQSYESNRLLPSSSPFRSASRSGGLLRLVGAGAGAAVLASGALGATTPFTPITPTSFVGNPIYENSRLGRTRKRKNLKRKTRKLRR